MYWEYRGRKIEKIEDFPEGTFGFIYEMHFSNGMRYIGQKALFHNRTLPPLKGKKRKRKVKKESDWKTYIGSIKDEDFKKGIKDGTIKVIDKVIVDLCSCKKEMTYKEVKAQFVERVLERSDYYNGNILGKFYKMI